MEILSINEIKNIINQIDSYNSYDLNSFSETISDYCVELTDEDISNIVSFIENELTIYSDKELKNIENHLLYELYEYTNHLFD